MALSSEVWIFCLIFLLAGTAVAEESNTTTVTAITTTTTTTTESSGTIKIPIWIFYFVIIPILGIATVAGIITLFCCICSKRHGSVLPKKEPEKKCITNDLNNGNGDRNESIVDHFVVSHESKKLSKKPKKAVNSLVKKDMPSSTKQETVPGIENLTKAIDLATKRQKKEGSMFQEDAICENAFNHLQEESKPIERVGQFQRPQAATNRSESLNNKFKLENENEDRPGVSNTRRMHRKQRKFKRSTSTSNGNVKPIESKLKKIDITYESSETRKETETTVETIAEMTEEGQETDTTEETVDETTESSTSTVFTSSEEESILDQSYEQDGHGDVITDDEDSGAENVTFQQSDKKKVLETGSSIEAKDKDILRSKMRNDESIETLKDDDIPTTDVTTNTINRNKLQSTNTEEAYIQIKSSEGSKGYIDEKSISKSLTKESESDTPTVKMRTELSSISPADQQIKTCLKDKPKETVKKPTHDHVSRMRPVATSSFKLNPEERENVCNSKQTDAVNEAGISPDVITHDFQQEESSVTKARTDSDMKVCGNYKQFEDAVLKHGKINLNRSISLNETDINKDEINCRRRKRKYQSLRHARKESVFDALKTLDKTPMKGILRIAGRSQGETNNKANSPASKSKEGIEIMGDEKVKDFNLSEAQHTEYIDSCELDNELAFPFPNEDHKISLAPKGYASVLSKSFSVKLSKKENNTKISKRSRTPEPPIQQEIIVQTSTNVTNIENIPDFDQNRQDVFNKQQRNETIETGDNESVADSRPEMSDGNSHKKLADENYELPEIVSSNLHTNDATATNLKKDAMFDFSKRPDNVSFETNETSGRDDKMLSPILFKKVVNEQKPLVEDAYYQSIEKKDCLSVSDSGSESNVFTNSDLVTDENERQEKIETLQATDSDDDLTSNRTKVKMNRERNKKEPVITPDEKDTNIFPMHSQYSPREGRIHVQLLLYPSLDDMKLTEESIIKFEEKEVDELAYANIFMSERGLLYSKERATSHSNDALLPPPKDSINQNINQVQPSISTSIEPDLDPPEPPDTPSSKLADSFGNEAIIIHDLTSKPIMDRVKTFTEKRNDMQTVDCNNMSYEIKSTSTTSFPTEHPKTIFTDSQITTTLQTNNETNQPPDDINHHAHLQQKRVARKLMLQKEIRHLHDVETERSNTPVLTNDGLKISTIQHKRANSLKKIKRSKSNPLFDHLVVETIKLERSINSTTHTSNLANPVSYLKMQNINQLPKKEPSITSKRDMLAAPKTQGGVIKQENITDVMSPNAYSKQQDFATGSENKIKNHLDPAVLQKKPPIHSNISREHPANVGILEARRDKLKYANVLSIHVKRNEENNNITRGHNDFRPRSKTPSVELERSPEYHQVQKRSKTPSPFPTYIRSNTETYIPSEWKVKQQTHHMESFSRNFPKFPVDKSQFKRSDHQKTSSISSLRNKRPNSTVFGKNRSNDNMLLNKRGKENNTLNGRENARKPSERDRPKSAMSLRSAPRSIAMETCLTIHVKARNDNQQMREESIYHGNGKLTSEKAQHYTSMNKQSHLPQTRGNDIHNNYDLTDSDSELEEFFANPDAEVLHFGNPNDTNKDFVDDHARVFSSYNKRNKLGKAISFKL